MAEHVAVRDVELAPQLPAQAPGHLQHLLAGLDESVKLDAPASALRYLREALAFMLGYFTDVVASASVGFGASSELFLRQSGQKVQLSEAENRLREGLHFLSNHLDKPVARALVGVFFDPATQAPRDYYALTQGGKVQGKVGGGRLSDFCKEPKRPVSRNEAVKQRSLYLPHLAAWVVAARFFWEEGKLLHEHTSLEGLQEVALEVGGVALVAGPRCDLKGCVACIPCRNLKVPASLAGEQSQIGVPQGVPEHTTHLTDRLANALEKDDPIEACRLMRDTLEFLMRYFAGVATILCRQMNVFPSAAHRYTENYQLVDNCERLLHLCVETLKEHPDDASAKLLVGVFYRRNEHYEYVPRAQTDVLLLEDVLSSWFKTERGGVIPTQEKSRQDFERYFPLLRDWLSAMGAYFSQAEHFEEPPKKDGKLPLTLRLGERLLELIEPDYILRIRQCPVCLPDPEWLTNPRPAAPRPPAASPAAPEAESSAPSPQAQETAAAPAPPAPVELPKLIQGEFRTIVTPNRCPRFLERVLKRLDVHLRRDEMAPTWTALRDALDYQTRYWSGVLVCAAKHLECLPARAVDMAESSMSVEECENMLILCLEALLEKPDDELTQEIRAVFFTREQFSEQDRPTGSHARMIMMDADPKNKMKLLSEFCARQPEHDKHKCRREVKTYLPVLRDWLASSQRFLDQCEHYEEPPDREGRVEFVIQFDQIYLEMVAPDYIFYVRPGSDLVPELEVPEYLEPEEVQAPVEVAQPTKRFTQEEIAMQEPFLLHKVAYVGLQKNSQGVMCKSGIIKIQNAGGGTLTGTAFSTHPCVEVSPRRFKDKSQLTYWLDESEVPRDYSPVVVLRAGGDERQVTLNEMRPLGKLSTINQSQARTVLAVPSVLSLLIFAAALLVVGTDIHHILVNLPRGNLKTLAPTELDEMLIKGNLLGWYFIIIPVLAPWISFLIYSKLPPTLQDLMLPQMRKTLMLPSWIVLALVILPVFRTDVTMRPEIYNLYMPRLVPAFVFFNAATAFYIHLRLGQKIEEWIEEPAFQKIIPVVLLGIYIMCATLALM